MVICSLKQYTSSEYRKMIKDPQRVTIAYRECNRHLKFLIQGLDLMISGVFSDLNDSMKYQG